MLLIYITKIKPLRPEKGKITNIKISLPSESKIEFLKVVTCWSSPFKSPSEIESRYIKGTMGASALIMFPTCTSP